ncbi:hypothetical protein [Methanohalophilus euhalobius]|nr:hypothetical protein [Methanohalophilus euhalobius]
MSEKEIEESTLGYVTDGIIHLTNKEKCKYHTLDGRNHIIRTCDNR